MDVPIERRLSNEVQARMARLQDLAIDALYSVDEKIVLHGGTAIWRCYSGNRFSDDLDLYVKTKGEISSIRNDMPFALKRYGIEVPKASAIGNSTVMNIRDSGAEVRLEIGVAPSALRPVEMSFERSNGMRTSILTLSPEDLIAEKIVTYSSRRYARDLYDIYHLSPLSSVRAVQKIVCAFIDDIKPPVDEGSLESIVYSGAAPSFGGMVDSIRVRFCEIPK